MEKTFIKVEDAKKEFRELLEAKEVKGTDKPVGDGNFQVDNTFYIHKSKMLRHEAMNKLSSWFDTKMIEGHYIEFSPITLIWTTFKIKKLE